MNQFSTVRDIPIDQIVPNPNQPRKYFEEGALNELAQSIKIHGVIQPITVRKIKYNQYELVSGERRWRATVEAGLKTIPAIITAMTDEDSALIAIIENVQREDLNFFEEAESYRQLIKTYDYTQEKVAKMLGKSQSFIANKLRLLKMDDEVIDAINKNKLTERHARSILRVPDKKLQLNVIKKIAKKGLNVKATEDLVEKIRNNVLTNNYSESITPDKKARVKSFINVQIYVNTIKNAFKMVKETKKDAEYSETVKDDYVEIKIRLPR